MAESWRDGKSYLLPSLQAIFILPSLSVFFFLLLQLPQVKEWLEWLIVTGTERTHSVLSVLINPNRKRLFQELASLRPHSILPSFILGLRNCVLSCI